MYRMSRLALPSAVCLVVVLTSMRAWAVPTLSAATVSFTAATGQYQEVDTFSDGSTTSRSGAGSSVDISTAIVAGANVQLSDVDAIVTLSAPATTYAGVISGTGTLRVTQTVDPHAATGTGATAATPQADGGPNPVRNGASLTLTSAQTLSIPVARQTESTMSSGGVVTILGTANPPVLTIDPGVTVQFQGANGTQVNFLDADASGQVNLDNLLDDGVLEIVSGGGVGPRIGEISGTGSVTGDAYLVSGTSALSGVMSNGIQCFYGAAHITYSMPDAKAIINDGSLLVSAAPGSPNVVHQNIFESHFGDDINTDTGLNIFVGLYSNSNNTSRQRPNLVDPGLVDPRSDGTKVTGTIGKAGDPLEMNVMILDYSGA
jgi:hypothetical protein